MSAAGGLARLSAALALLLVLSTACGGGAPDGGGGQAGPSVPSPGLTQAGAAALIAVGESHVCDLRRDGTIVCRGNVHGGWPDGGGWVRITSGRDFSCALRGDGTLACWGVGAHGETDPPDGRFASVDAGRRHACALDAAGFATCWGRDDDGRTAAPPDVAFASIGAGDAHGCGLTPGGELRCWGANGDGQAEPRPGPFRALAVGARHTCALRGDGTAFCQGSDGDGEASPPDTAFLAIAAGDGRTCGIAAGGSLTCWGRGRPLAPEGAFASVSVGRYETCAVRTDGRAECWPHGPSPDGGGVRAELALAGRDLDQPVELFPWPGGGLAVADRSGYVDVYAPDGAEPRRALDLTGLIATACCDLESGLLSAAPDPEFGAFPYLYVYWTADAVGEADMAAARLSRFPVAGGRAVREDELVILDIPLARKHFGGAVRFGPDGMLYLSLGDLGSIEDAQDPGTLGGTIVRIDVRGATAQRPYRVPDDNPFAASPDARPEIWAYGLRNPWRMHFGPDGRLWVGDVGQNSFEEVSIASAGANLGWPAAEGDACYWGEDVCASTTPPAAAYGHTEGNCAVVGGLALPEPDGRYVFADFCSGRVWALEGGDGDWRMRELLDLPLSVSSFGRGHDGEVYVLTFRGPALRLAIGPGAGEASP